MLTFLILAAVSWLVVLAAAVAWGWSLHARRVLHVKDDGMQRERFLQ